jgi:predicted transcriptional regulator
MEIKINTKNMKALECLSSRTRVKILELLGEGPKNIGELASNLDVSSAITTRHISMLESAGIVQTKNLPGKRGLQKVCSLAVDKITLSLMKEPSSVKYNTVSIPIGQYASYKVSPPCGLASTQQLIGVSDDPRYFSDPDRVKASLLWFHTGWIEYKIPSYVMVTQDPSALEISLEICSEFPGYNENWPSDIHFSINDIPIGVWTSPGDFGDRKGTYTPDWWRMKTQYGLLKTLRITSEGSMLDGIILSDVSIDQIPIKHGQDLSLKISVPKDTTHPGGINIFGRGFGNYDQDIEVTVEY